MSIVTITSSVSHRSLMKKSKHDLASWILRLLETNTRQHKLLYTVAPSHQGGNGDIGFKLAEHLGIPHPITTDDLIKAAIRDELDPHELWPRLIKMRADRKQATPHAPVASDPALIALLKKSGDHQMTQADIAAQRKSWVTAEMMLADRDLTREQAEARYDAVTGDLAP